MTQDEIIEMAREAGLSRITTNVFALTSGNLERFADLVAAKAEERANERANASWKLMCEKMLATEREVCARIVAGQWTNVAEKMYGIECAAAIRARGQKEGA